MGHQTASLCVLWLALTLTSAVDVISGRNHNHGHYVCSTWGNYHFKTFDGDFYQFPGSCSYNLASHCGDSYQEFSVHVHRSMDSGHPLMDKITITIKDDVIIQLKNNLVLVNGAIARTPYYSFGILIHKTEDYFKVYTKTGLTLMWNKEDAVMLELDPKFNNHTCGLCGDYNGVHLYNEFFSGDNILKPIQFGNLQNIQDPNDKCTDPDETQEADTTHCSQYRSVCEEHLGYSAFTDCQSLLNLGNYIQACMLDMCSCDQSQDSFCLCSTITEYSRQCSHAGGRPRNWRSANFCPKQCPANMIYQESASPCKNSCSHLETLSLCEEHYMDGCFCLEGSVEDDYTDRGCVEVSECHCKHRGKLYAPGETMQNDCNECRCESGRWTCTDRACPGVCSIEGGAHFTTFDGKAYTFHGNCYYVLSKDQTNESHTILGEFSPCSSSDRDTCIKSVILLTDNLNNEVTFKADGTVLLNKLEVTLPHVTASFSILQPTDSYIIVQATFGLQMQIQRSPKMQLYITMEKSESRQLLGLCGDFNSKEGDDFKTSGGLVEATASAFANTWKAQPSCQDMSDWLDNPCSLSIENKRYANTWCSKLEKSEPFVKCHTTIDPTEYAKRCRYDSCSCKVSEVCICAALSSYVRACAAKGIILWGWRNHICDKDIASCPSSQVYLYNLTTCQPTCRSLAEGAKACSSVFTPVDGCGCPDREYLNEKHQCVPISKCSCYFDGTYLNPQDAIYKQDDRYICINGKLVCTNHGNETCPEGKVYFDCNKVQSDISGVPVQRSCKTLSIQYFQTKCISGCVCPDGLLDDGAGGCVPEDKCPCVHNEDVFPHGTQIPVDCNACLCQRGRWTCTDAVCYGTCTIYGNGHYITFDEKMYDFDGNCEFVAVHDYCGPKHSDGSFSIITENIPCGTTGVTCSKSIKVFLGSTVLKLAEKHIEEIETEGKKQVTYLIREVGIYLVIEASNNILLIWDRKTTIFIKVSPEYKDKLCGLCGNFDDNSQNEFKTRNILQVTDVLEFGNSWKVDSTCPDAKAVVNPCSQRPHRHSWAEKQCSLILSHVFKVCHSKVDPKPFYEACVNDACSCDSGGDCECFCTAVAAYAQECTKAEACVYWRTPDICPLFCDYYNPEDECEWHYYPCGNHSVETCRSINNVYTNVTITYLEGCYPTCPEDKPIFDELKKICVTKEECGCYINNAHYEIGEEVPRYKNCHKCVCSSKGKVECRITEDGELSRVQQSGLCIVVTCVNGKENLDINICSSTTPITTSTTSVTTIMPLAITVTTTTQLTSTIQHSSTTCVYEKVCQWSQWFDVSKPAEDLDSGDYEIYDEIRKKHPFCNVPDQIECRAANAHDVSLKELKQTVHCNVSYGLICRNSEQKPDKNLWQKCFNYEIRVDCCDYECIHSTPITTTPSTTTPTTTTPTTKTPIVISTITTTPTTTTPIVTSTFTITPTTTTPIVTSTFTTTPTNTTPIATTTFTTTPIVTSTFTTNPTTITPSTTNPIVTSTFTTTPTTTTLSTTTPIVTSTFTTTPTITTPSSTTPIGTSTFTTTPTTTTLSTTTPIVTSTFTTTPATTTPSTTTPIVTSTFTTTPTTTTPIATSTFTTTPTTTTPIVNSTFTTTPTTTTPSTTTPTTTTPTTTTPIVISTFTTTPTTTTPIVTSTITTTPTTTTPIVTSTFTTTPTNTTPIATTTFTTTPTTTTPIVTSTFTTNPTTITPSTTTPIVTSTFTTTPTTTTLSTTTPIVTSTFTTTPTITTPSSTTPIGTSTFTTTPTTTTLSTTTPIVTSTFTTTPATTTPSTTTPIVTSTFTTTPTTTTPIATSTFTTTPTTTTPIVNSTFTTTPTTTTPSTTTPIVTITFTTTPSTTTPIVTSTFTTTPTTTTSSTTTPIVTSTFATTPEITTRPLETTATTAPSSPTFTTTEIMTAPSCVPECSWSEWYNVMYPEYGDDGGDYETYEDIRKAGHHVCEKPENISCRAPDFSDTPLEESGQKVTCNVSYGLICNNKDQDELLPICHNYEISVYCCSPLPDYCLTTPPEITTITIQSSTITPGTIITETRITPHITATPETTAPTTTESTTATTPGTPTTSKPPDTATPKTITTNTETTTTTFPTKTFGINIETPKATTLTTKVSRQEFNTSSVTTTGLLNTTTPKASSTIPTMSETLPTTSSVSTAPLSTPTPETDILFSTMCICMFDGKTYLPGEIISGVANETWCYKVICNSECKSQVSYWLCSTSPPSKTTKFTTTQASSQTSTRSTGTSTETITTEKTTTHITPKVLPTTQKPGCFLQPFRQYNETWMLYNCTMARCLDNNQIEITELQCEPPAKITCANRHPPKAVQNADRCCWHWECDCVCSGWGDPHYVTFDGTYYSYQGNCTYVLVEEIEKRIDNFSIYIDNYDCGTKDRVSCPRNLIVQYKTQEIQLPYQNKHIQATANEQPIGIPFEKYGLKVYKSGIYHIVEIQELRAIIRYNGMDFAIQLPYSLFGHNTQGQCGTCTNNRADDCRTRSGEIASNCEIMADSWIVTGKPECSRVKPTVPPKTTVPSNDCQLSPLCNLIRGQPFKKCHKILPPDNYYQACVYDSCHVPNANIGCSSLQHYAQLCGDQGICIEWREKAPECPLTCPSHKVYNACGPTMPTTCKTNLEEDALIKDDKRLVEGCFCPQDTMRFSPDVDVCVQKCGCVGPDNIPRKLGERFQLSCQDCICMEGGSGITCKKQKCKDMEDVVCGLEGFYPETQINPSDPCCSETVCKCNPSRCSNKSPNCGLGYKAIAYIPMGHCCSLYKCVPKNVCVHRNAEYMPGAPVFSDNCQNCVCSEKANSTTGVEITCTDVPCIVRCPLGFTLKQRPEDCCGVCEQTHCVLSQNGHYQLMKPGEVIWSEKENCTIHNCTVIKDQFITSVFKISCPPFNEEDCEPGTIQLLPDGCCKTCNEKTMPCKLQTYNEYLFHENCRSEHTVKLSRCKGSCETSSIYSAAARIMTHSCTCCQEVQTSQKNITLKCGEKSEVDYEYIYVEKCECVNTHCGPVKSAEEQTPARTRRSGKLNKRRSLR